MDKLEKQRLMKEWLNKPARLKPLQTRATRSKRTIKKADKAVVRSSTKRFERGEQASQIWLVLKENNVVTEKRNNRIIHHKFNLENVTYNEFYQQFVDKTYSKRIMILLLSLIE